MGKGDAENWECTIRCMGRVNIARHQDEHTATGGQQRSATGGRAMLTLPMHRIVQYSPSSRCRLSPLSFPVLPLSLSPSFDPSPAESVTRSSHSFFPSTPCTGRE
eukprot:scaffold191111_cov34-Tisochrysis_lutea.AAC.3